MRPDTFISYSRQCMGFVDDLAHRLELQGFRVWLDYRSLIPGRPWLEQIHKGLDGADLLLLVISPESIASRAVELEWRHFLESGRRVILLIFQAVPLPPELSALEWVDFRGSYGVALRRLVQCIESPLAPAKPPPQSGFKAPLIVWLAAAASVLTALYSLTALWTFLIPWVLIPLPARIFKRNFNLPKVQTALWTLPLAIFFSQVLASELGLVNLDAEFDSFNYFSLYNLGLLIQYLWVFFVPLTSIFLVLILRSPSMQRWGKPEATLSKFANIYDPQISHPQPIRFHIDHAFEDGLVARELSGELEKYGHTPVADHASAQEVLVLVSRYKMDTLADPEQKVVIPILVQKVKVSEKLSKLQWIDFRRGVRNLDAIAQLLPQPTRMLAALGVRPTGSGQDAVPAIVSALVDYLIIMGMLDLGSLLSYLLELGHSNFGMIFERETLWALWLVLLEVVAVLLSGGLIYTLVKDLTERHGRLASPGSFLLGLAGVLALFTCQGFLSDSMDSIFMKYGIVTGAIFAALPFLVFIFGALIVGIAVFIKRNDLRRWFPLKVPKQV